MHNLGTGVLNWEVKERRTDRYGSVFLLHSPDPLCDERVEILQVKSGTRGRLIAIVKETRQSYHIGDLFHQVFPTMPSVGQKIILGEGTLFFENNNNVGLQPDNGRDDLWLDINALFKLHHQTVTLFFEESLVN